MIALVIFSMLIGMSGGFIAAGVNRPFVADRVEPWLTLMEESRIALQQLPPDSELLLPGSHNDPFPKLKKPAVMTSWKLEWANTNLNDWQVARFSATTILDKTIQWHVFHRKE